MGWRRTSWWCLTWGKGNVKELAKSDLLCVFQVPNEVRLLGLPVVASFKCVKDALKLLSLRCAPGRSKTSVQRQSFFSFGGILITIHIFPHTHETFIITAWWLFEVPRFRGGVTQKLHLHVWAALKSKRRKCYYFSACKKDEHFPHTAHHSVCAQQCVKWRAAAARFYHWH